MHVEKKPSIIVWGNAKGGVGKSTLALHFALQCMHEKLSVACLDADGDQGTLFRSIENRKQYCRQKNLSFPIPEIIRFRPSAYTSTALATTALDELLQRCEHFDIIVIDTQGSDTPVGRYVHQRARILISPVTESPLDLDLFVNISEIQEQSHHTLPLGSYAHMVWEQRLTKASQTQEPLEWVVLRNRMSSQISRTQIHLEKILKSLAPRVGFYIGPSVGDRSIFRELFPYGLTVLDREGLTTLAHITARQEIKSATQFILSLLKKKEKS
ncbi:division plane positioning ATPase MipZ [Holospora curviuscula]|uniref:ATPase MipZ n=1 Tax=Holospora curviuscula TaxID=1082868 RepID=A0A2S5R7A1_9PROT|nr:division plane positioning ATPase MipZ [Holospora curviuscula]PPE03216.1 ATPase MipZ [Holospora curviuscula]